jgi:activating signal cointegrator complex subunit 2
VEDAQASAHENGLTHLESGQENTVDLDLEDMEGACAFDINEATNAIDPMEAIRAVLPDLGDGFIKKLLQRYDDPEQAISAVLEGNLPPDLMEADFEEPEIPVDKYDVFFTNTGIDRLNIYDGDAYDVMTQDQPKGIIKRGKGFPGANSQTNVLNDKSDVQAVRSKYVEYSIVCDEVDENKEYDDEYDDSYDALAESERKTTKALLANEIDEESEDECIESEDEQDKGKNRNYGTTRNGKDFCENPEAIRARYEQSRQDRFGAKTGTNKDWKNRFVQNKFWNYFIIGSFNIFCLMIRDVVGKPKGQGQSTEVLQNRVKKTLNKSTRANHNRKSGK